MEIGVEAHFFQADSSAVVPETTAELSAWKTEHYMRLSPFSPAFFPRKRGQAHIMGQKGVPEWGSRGEF
jgi:hypothetical protein